MVCFHTEAAKKSAIKLDYLKKPSLSQKVDYLKYSFLLRGEKRTEKNLHDVDGLKTKKNI